MHIKINDWETSWKMKDIFNHDKIGAFDRIYICGKDHKTDKLMAIYVKK
jgi:hypothetical protein